MASTIEHEEEGKKGPSMVMLLVAYGVITLIAGGAGFGVSATMLKPASMAPATNMAASKVAEPAGHAPAAASHGAESGHGTEPAEHGDAAQKLVVVDLPSITTNLVDPTDAWIRMELSLVFEGESDKALAQDVHQDIIAYVHTMKLYNLRGGSGYQHLIEDLGERAAIRTEGRVKRVLVRSLILE
jgi:flagellar FliL protein